jgi:hypothetical protein
MGKLLKFPRKRKRKRWDSPIVWPTFTIIEFPQKESSNAAITKSSDLAHYVFRRCL